MILKQDPATGYWTRIQDDDTAILRAHEPWDCSGALCDVHNRRGEDPWASWKLNWRDDRTLMEGICEHGVGHPTPAQIAYWHRMHADFIVKPLASHGCDGCCAGSLDQLKETA